MPWSVERRQKEGRKKAEKRQEEGRKKAGRRRKGIKA